MTKKKRPTLKEINAGHWDVADPSPAIINLLKRLDHWDDRNVMTDEARVGAKNEVKAILEAWAARENLKELRNLLGVSQMRGRRRSQRTVDRETGIAFAAFEQVARGKSESAAVQIVAAEVSVDEKTVRRAMRRWPSVERSVKLIHERMPNVIVVDDDYTSLLTRDKK